MSKYPAAVSLLTIAFFTMQLAGCDSKPEAAAPAVQATAGGATATVTQPAGQTQQAATEATATIGADGSVEAKAGDASVKLPN